MSDGRQEGFSLLEVLVTLAVLAILTSIAVPVYQGYITGMKKGECKANLQSLKLLLERYNADYNQYCKQGDEPCAGAAYDYKEDADGNPTSQTIVTDYLTSFKPKSSSTSKAVLYDYSVTVDSELAYTIMCTPVAGRAPAGTLCINQDGKKDLAGCVDW